MCIADLPHGLSAVRPRLGRYRHMPCRERKYPRDEETSKTAHYPSTVALFHGRRPARIPHCS